MHAGIVACITSIHEFVVSFINFVIYALSFVYIVLTSMQININIQSSYWKYKH